MHIVDYLLAAWLAFGALALVASIGKPRKPVEPAAGAIAVVIYAAWIVALVVSHGGL